MLKENILVVEDEKYLLESITEMLSLNGYNVYSADTGNKAIKLLENEDVDFVVSDINLPDISGYDILKYAKSNIYKHKVPFVFLSAFADEVDIRKGMNEGADDYLTKPFKFQTLLDTIESRLKIHKNKNILEESRLNDTLIKVLNNNFSHEFLTPLNGILSLAKIIVNETESSDELKQLTNAIYTSGYRMYRNVRKLLLYSLIETNSTISYTKEEVNVSDLLRNVMNRSFENFKHNIDIVNNITVAEQSSEILEILFEEIIDNAIKYSAIKTIPDVRLYKTNDNFFFKVSNVIGNNASFTEKEIKPFTKFHDDKTMNGLGLGLYISKHICNVLGLNFSIENVNSIMSITIVSSVRKK